MTKRIDFFIWSLIALTLFSSCEKDLYEEAIQSNKQTTIKEVKFNDLIKDAKFKTLLEKVSHNSASSRSAFEDQNGFTISNTNIKVIESDSLTSYTMLIQRDNNVDETSFENLVIQEDVNNNQKAYVIKYTPSEITPSADNSFSYEGTIQKNRLAFTGFNKNANQNTTQSDCFVDILMCNQSWSGGLGSEHVAGKECKNVNYMYVKKVRVLCPNDDAGGGFSSGSGGDQIDNPYDSNTGTGNGGSGNETGDNNDYIVTDPVDNESDAEILTSPIKNPSLDIDTNQLNANYFFNSLTPTQQQWATDNPNAYSQLIQHQIDNNWSDESEVFAEELIEIIINIQNDDTLSEDEKNKLIELTIDTLLNNEPWQASPGNYNGIASLHFTHKRTTYVNGQQCFQYRLDNGDFLAYMNYGEYSDINMKTFYYSQPLKNWYEIPEPTGSTYNHTDVDFIFEAFWGAVYTTTRYCTPLEDAVILIEGRDFDGVTSSRASAGVFILIDLVPGGKALKITKKAGYALSAASPVSKKIVTALYKTQRSLRKQYKLTISTMSAARKGNFGEICTDLDFYEKGYDVLHVNRVNSIDSPIQQGIDHIFKNPQTGEFIIVESKFHGTGGLSTLVDGTRQMSDTWIRGSHTLNTNNRLWMALGQDTSLYNQVAYNYKRVIAYVQPDGTINYKYVSSDGYEISTPFLN